MNCYLHPETPASAFCRTCGRALCTACQRSAEDTVFCQDHVPVSVGGAYTAPGAGAYAGGQTSSGGPAGAPGGGAPGSNPYFAPGPPNGVSPVQTSPGLAFVLGIVPGVGAIYNGQYLKGLVHALVFGLLVTLVSNSEGSGAEALVGILLGAFCVYMPFEAYHTAKKRRFGIRLDEWSSILPATRTGRVPVGPIVLILIGVLYLLNSLDLVNFRQIGRFWPVVLIIIGAYMLYNRVAPATPPPAMAPPSPGQPYTAAPNAGMPPSPPSPAPATPERFEGERL